MWQTLGHLVNFEIKTKKVPQSIVSGQGDELYDAQILQMNLIIIL